MTVDSKGQLRSRTGDRGSLLVERLFAVLVLWQMEEPRAWRGWLTTFSRRSIQFSATDLAAPTFQRWLVRLPDWEPENLSFALAVPGFHLVWRESRYCEN